MYVLLSYYMYIYYNRSNICFHCRLVCVEAKDVQYEDVTGTGNACLTVWKHACSEEIRILPCDTK